ncbi:glycoside hydrolase family 3 protein [Actinomadura madurae]|uniref:glycoside hydrolase family 3 protein n=1 Tax=Actinomadura madurae TaxID=1993 RepID=UPI0020D23E3F|nr:glycoside hydrolase family 3 C-terminal domain-containing protein [Actinomadura madurae]
MNGPYRFHQPSYAALANQAARESITLLKNDGVLPLKLREGDDLVVAGPRATDGAACCIWTSYFHPNHGSLTLLDAIKARVAKAGVTVHQDSAPAPDLAVVAVGEPSYTHATAWVNERPYLPPDQLALIRRFHDQGVPVVVVMDLPRPTVISEWNGIADAIVMTYRGGEEVGPATAGLLFGDYQPRGRLPWQLPRTVDQILRPGGVDRPEDAVENWNIPYDLGATPGRTRRDPRPHRRGPAPTHRLRRPPVPLRRRHPELAVAPPPHPEGPAASHERRGPRADRSRPVGAQRDRGGSMVTAPRWAGDARSALCGGVCLWMIGGHFERDCACVPGPAWTEGCQDGPAGRGVR